MGTLAAYPDKVRADASTLVMYQGAANRAIQWSLTGSGTLLPLTDYTDVAGRAAAIYTPGSEGDVITVGVTVGT
jgi:hypothetical protein